MKALNIYYMGVKLNSAPLPLSMLDELKGREYVWKKSGRDLIKIPVDDIQAIKCTII